MSTDDLQNLPLVEKLRLVEQLWDEISSSTEPFPLHPWQQAEARRRAADLDDNPEMGLSRREVWEQARQSVSLSHLVSDEARFYPDSGSIPRSE
jgi:putative addiction module component (TIGR02574 family)